MKQLGASLEQESSVIKKEKKKEESEREERKEEKERKEEERKDNQDRCRAVRPGGSI